MRVIIDLPNVGGAAKHVAWLEVALCERGIASVDRPDLRAEMGRAGAEFARRSFAKECLVEDIATLYRDLVEPLDGGIREQPVERAIASPAPR